MILLDTHALVWWVAEPGRLPAKARRRLERVTGAGEPLQVSSISAWEVAMLVKRGRLELTMDVGAWMDAVDAVPTLEFVPVDNRVALRAAHLPDTVPGDPADRIIVATALGLGATLVTADAQLRRYRPLRTLWN